MKTICSVTLGVFLLAFVSVAALAGTIYFAPDNNNLYSNNQIGFAPCCGYEPGGVISGPFGVGNTITFAGSGPTFKLGSVDLFGYAGGGSKPIELDLYAGINPNTAGTLLASAQVTPTGNGFAPEVFNFSGLTVPKTLTFIVSIVGNSGSYGDSFVNWQQFTGITGAPTVGTSGDMWYCASGSCLVDNSYATTTGAQTNTLAAQFVMVPETVSLSQTLSWAIGLVGFVGVTRRRLMA